VAGGLRRFPPLLLRRRSSLLPRPERSARRHLKLRKLSKTMKSPPDNYNVSSSTSLSGHRAVGVDLVREPAPGHDLVLRRLALGLELALRPLTGSSRPAWSVRPPAGTPALPRYLAGRGRSHSRPDTSGPSSSLADLQAGFPPDALHPFE
jgi:hypothetical protein